MAVVVELKQLVLPRKSATSVHVAVIFAWKTLAAVFYIKPILVLSPVIKYAARKLEVTRSTFRQPPTGELP